MPLACRGRPTDARSAFERALALAEQEGKRPGCALALSHPDIAERQDRSACERLARVVRLSAAKGFHTHPVQAASIYGELLAARQQPLLAAGVWLMARAEPALDEMDREGASALFDRLALDEAQRTCAAQSVPTLEQVLAWIDADARRPD